MRHLIALALVLAACGGSSGPAGPAAPEPTPTPSPTPSPWVIKVVSFKYSTTALLGGVLTGKAVVRNNGTARSPGLEFQFGGLKDNADLVGCSPNCQVSNAFGDWYATFPGVGAGKKITIEFEFLPTKIGAAHWSVIVYDAARGGEPVYYGEGTTRIR